ncbi:hypothetical protein BDN72DRAFT_468654 [Pluteus cervinus]|uniref:Uncharacterized protein n=1 Tax=Pluteus cervinus TaxID=181527 RepID=A0ACD3B0F2_9AGAR|nr:hypothetical protein BDN72DRAFT_468654 [Pluteus cervinus]
MLAVPRHFAGPSLLSFSSVRESARHLRRREQNPDIFLLIRPLAPRHSLPQVRVSSSLWINGCLTRSSLVPRRWKLVGYFHAHMMSVQLFASSSLPRFTVTSEKRAESNIFRYPGFVTNGKNVNICHHSFRAPEFC